MRERERECVRETRSTPSRAPSAERERESMCVGEKQSEEERGRVCERERGRESVCVRKRETHASVDLITHAISQDR